MSSEYSSEPPIGSPLARWVITKSDFAIDGIFGLGALTSTFKPALIAASYVDSPNTAILISSSVKLTLSSLAIFFKIFGVSWFSYVLHASIFNFIITIATFYTLIKLNLNVEYSFLYSTLVTITPALAEIERPGSSINLSLLPENIFS